MTDRDAASQPRRWVPALFIVVGGTAFLAGVVGAPTTLAPGIAGLTIGALMLVWSAIGARRAADGQSSRFGENGAVLDRMSDEMRAEYENPSYGGLQVDPEVQRENMLAGICVGAVALLGAWLMPAGYDLPLAVFGAVLVLMVLSGLDLMRTWNQRRDRPQRSLPWAEKDRFSKLATIGGGIAFAVIYANVINGLIFENLSITSPLQ